MTKKKAAKGNKANKAATSSRSKIKKTSWSIFQKAPESDNEAFYQKAFWISFLVISLVTLVMAVQTGVNEDDKFHYPYSELLQNYYYSFGQDTAALNVEYGRMHLYGGFLDMVSGTINSALGFETVDNGYRMVRHIVNGLIGLLAFLFAGLLGRRIGGWRAGLFAMSILFLSPKFLGHTGINPRDMPFAAGYIMAIYFMVRFFEEIPKVQWKTVAGLAAGIALAFATRSGGLLLFAYFGLFGLIHLWRTYSDNSIQHKGLFGKYLLYGGVAAVAGYFITFLFWPFGLAGPIKNVLASLTEFSNLQISLRVLFDGEMIWSNRIPTATYVLTWIGIAMSLITLIGVAIFTVFSRGIFTRSNRFFVGIPVFVLLFPIAYIIYKQSNLFTGMRHLLFIVPPMAVVAGLGWDYLFYKFQKQRSISLAVGGFMAVLAVLPLSHIIMNFNTCYVYFNEFTGGVKGALGNYEMDYWGVSIKRAVEWMEDEGIFDGDEEIVLASNSNFVLKQYIEKHKNAKVVYSRFRERYERDWDYAIYVNQFIDGAHLRGGKLLDNNVIKVIGKNGAPFCIIYKNSEGRPATKGFEALKANNLTEAVNQFTLEVINNPNNENAWNGLGQAHFNQQQYPEAEAAFNKALEINAESQVAISYLSLSLLNQNRMDEALVHLDKAIALNPGDFNSRYYKGMIFARKGDQSRAIEELKEVLKLNPRHRQTYQLLIQTYQQMGDTQQANYFQQMMSQYVR
jgi:hypothetical protein